jgi:2-oxoglutarate ferredoxin oxidoreductase subunit alpha
MPTAKPRIEAVNDFVVKFANVNGSGSASANEMFARSLLRMGVPVSPRNIFPSNIQGLPTWYEVRVNEAGYLRPGRRTWPRSSRAAICCTTARSQCRRANSAMT